MTIKVSEAVDNQDYKKTATLVTFSQKYFVTGAGSVYQATQAPGIPDVGDFYVDIDLTNPAVPVETPSVIPCINIHCSNINSTDNIHEITADYEFRVNNPAGGSSSAPENPVDGDEFYVIASTNATAHVNVSPLGILPATYASPGSAPDANGLIGLQAEGDVNGVDIIDEYYSISVTLYKDAVDVDAAYITALNELRGTTNIALWYGAAIQSTLYQDFRISDFNTTLKIIEFDFLVGKNKITSELTGFRDKLGATIVITGGKEAHQYIWSRAAESTVAGATKSYSTGVYVETVYDRTQDWTPLGLSGDL